MGIKEIFDNLSEDSEKPQLTISELLSKLDQKVERTVGEKQNKVSELIVKIKEIQKRYAVEDSKKLREILKRELSETEFNEATKILDEVTNSTSQEDKNNPLAQIEKKVDKFEKMFEKFDRAGEIWDKVSAKGGSLGWLNGLLAAFSYFFMGKIPEGIDVSWIKKEIKTAEQTAKKETAKLSKEKTQIIKEPTYIAGIKLLLLVSRENTPFGYDILMQKTIRNKSYNALDIDNLKEEGLSKKLGLEGVFLDKDIYETLSMLKSNEEYIEKIIGKNNSDWKNQPIEELFTSFYKYIKPMDKLKNLSIGKIKSGDVGEIFRIDFQNSENGTLNELLKDRLEDPTSKLKGVDKTFLLGLYTKESSDFDKKRLMGREGVNEEFVDDFIVFRKGLPDLIGNDFFHGKEDAKDDFKKFFQNHKFTHKEVLELYIITNGELDKLKYNDFQEGLIMFKIFSIMGPGLLSGNTYGFMVMDILLGGTSFVDKIPASFKLALQDFVLESGKKIAKETVGILGEIWGSLPTEYQLGTVGMSVLIFFGTFYLAPYLGVAVRFITVGRLLTITSIGGLGVVSVYKMLSEIPEVKPVLKKHGINNPTELAELTKKEVELRQKES